MGTGSFGLFNLFFSACLRRSELGESFARRLMTPPLQARHVVHPSQLRILCLPSLPDFSGGGAALLQRSLGIEELALPTSGDANSRLSLLRRQQQTLKSFRVKDLNCRNANLFNDAFLADLGRSVALLLQSLPKGGVLVFLPSYKVLRKAERLWKTTPFLPNSARGCGGSGFHHRGRGMPQQQRLAKADAQQGVFVDEERGICKVDEGAAIWSVFAALKSAVYCEDRDARVCEALKRNFSRSVREAGGALALAVYRGRLSEGMSFNDDLCRGVICVGIPYPAAGDAQVCSKREFNDALNELELSQTELLQPQPPETSDQRKPEAMARKAASAGEGAWISGQRWYSLQGFRALNQAVGRCIRHV